MILPADQQLHEGLEQHADSYRESAAVLDVALAHKRYLIADAFSVTDIIVGYTCHFGQKQQLNEGFDNILAYLARLQERPACPYQNWER